MRRRHRRDDRPKQQLPALKMKLQEFHKRCIRAKSDRPQPAYFWEVCRCAVDDRGDSIVVDRDSACFRALMKKYARLDRRRRERAADDGGGVPGGSRGLGDTIARATAVVGVKPCGGCQKRRQALNRLIPYKRAKT